MKHISKLSIPLLFISLHVGALHAETNLNKSEAIIPYEASVQDNGSVIIKQGEQIIKLLEASAVKKLGLEKSTTNKLLEILVDQQIAPRDLESSLSIAAKNYSELRHAVTDIQVSNKTLQALKTRAEKAVANIDFITVKNLLNQIYQLSLSAKPQVLLTAAEADAANGARANAQLSYEEAADYYARAASGIESLGEKHHVKWSDYADKAGIAFQEAGYYPEAGSLLKIALRLRQQHTPNSDLTIVSMGKLANLHRLRGAYEEALPLYQGIVDYKQNSFGSDHINVASSMNGLADIYRLSGAYEKALPYYQKALSISENSLGTDHADLATTLNNLAGLYEVIGDHEAALPLYQRAIKISEKALGEDHPDVGTMLNNLAGLYRAMGDFETALPLYERDLAISQKALGEYHPGVATTMNNLGILYFHMKNYEKAVDHLREALIIFEIALGENHPKTTSVNESLEAISKYL